MEGSGPFSSSFLSVAVAVNGRKSSRDAVKWALDRFVPEGRILFYLLHVRAASSPGGTEREKSGGWETKLMVQDYQQMCDKRQVQMELVILEADDIPQAIAHEISRRDLCKLVVGASSSSIFSRKIRSGKLSRRIAELAPRSCEVYAVSKGKLSSCRASSSFSEVDRDDDSLSSSDSRIFSSDTSLSEWTESDYPLAVRRDRALKVVNESFRRIGPSGRFFPAHSRSASRSYEELGSSSIRLPDFGTAAAVSSLASGEEMRGEIGLPFELERLKIELGHLQEMCAKAQNETTDVFFELDALSLRRTEEKERLREINSHENEAREAMRELKQKREAAEREARHTRERAELEIEHRKDAEKDALCAAEEKRRLEVVFLGSAWRYTVFDWEEILSATKFLSDGCKIGGGASGRVYLGTALRHMKVAIKVLLSNETYQTRQFKRQLEVLGGIRHPHLLLLLGACPERGCLVYEYMEKGSLEERLPELSWAERFRISWEVASALAFLHSARPEPIVHGDLKPSNILLDCNLVSKIGDVGLSLELSRRETAMESDVHALGVVLLQLGTGRGAPGLVPLVEAAMEEENGIEEVLDHAAGRWPLEQAKELLRLGLRCSALRPGERPELTSHVLPALERLKSFALNSQNSPGLITSAPPSHFVCPILKEVMEDPCVASDGYTYDRRAIEIWLSLNQTSPTTNLPLPSKTLIPNHMILQAIEEWRFKNS